MIELKVERRETEAMVRRYSNRLRSIQRPLRGWANWLLGETERQFATETDPDGQPWAALAPSTLRQKRALGYPDDILTRTGDMRRSVRIVLAGRYEVAIAVDFPAQFHQSGTAKMPQRRILGLNERRRNRLVLRVRGYLRNGR